MNGGQPNRRRVHRVELLLLPKTVGGYAVSKRPKHNLGATIRHERLRSMSTAKVLGEVK